MCCALRAANAVLDRPFPFSNLGERTSRQVEPAWLSPFTRDRHVFVRRASPRWLIYHIRRSAQQVLTGPSTPRL